VSDTHYCPRCRLDLPLSAFGVRIVNGREHPTSYCRECECDYGRRHRSASGVVRHRPTEAEECARWRAIDEARARAAIERLMAIRECPKCGNVGLQRGRRHDWHSNTLDVWCICGWSDSVATTPSGRVVGSLAG
jgi:hypothetical protein